MQYIFAEKSDEDKKKTWNRKLGSQNKPFQRPFPLQSQGWGKTIDIKISFIYFACELKHIIA